MWAYFCCHLINHQLRTGLFDFIAFTKLHVLLWDYLHGLGFFRKILEEITEKTFPVDFTEEQWSLSQTAAGYK